MSNWLSEFSGEEQRQVDEVTAQGITGKATVTAEKGLFDGVATALPRGAGAGFAKVANTIAKPIDAVADRVGYAFKDVHSDEFIEPFSEYKDKQEKARDDLIYSGIEALEDKENTGTVGNVLFSLGDYATRAATGSAVAGPLGAAAVTGASETDYVYGDLTREGVDEETALKVALTDGGVAAASTFLPMSYGWKGTGGVIKDGLLSVGGASGLSIGGQAISGAILKSEGYDKQAKKYEITNESVITDIGLNILFFGAARGAGKYFNNPDVAPEQQQAALVLNELEFEETLAPVKPANPVQANNHLKNLDDAVDSVRMGRPVRVQHAVEGEEKQPQVNYQTMAIPTNAKTIARKAQQEGIPPSSGDVTIEINGEKTITVPAVS